MVGTISNPVVANDGLEVQIDIEGLDGNNLTGIETGKSVSMSVGGATIPLSFVSASNIAGTAVLSDTFSGTSGDGVNGRTPDTTQPGLATWVESGASDGVLGIDSTGGRCWVQTNGTVWDAEKDLTINTGLTDCVIQANIYCGSKSNRYYFIYLKYVDQNNWVRIKILARGAECILQENNAGTITDITTSTAFTTVFNQTDTWLVTVLGTSVKVEVIGFGTVLTGSFSLHTSNTYQGWGLQASADIARLDDITVSNSSQARVTLNGDSLILNGESPLLSADAGAFNDGSNLSLATSNLSSTNNSTQSPETDLPVVSVEVVNSTDINITLTTQNVRWGTPSLNINNVKIWAVSGYGHPNTAELASNRNGLSIKISVRADRTLYKNEVIELELLSGWLSCARGNTGKEEWKLRGADPSVNGSTPPATAAVISNGRTSITLSSPMSVSFYLDGVPAIVVPSTVSITSETPTRTTDTGDTVHGAAHNPNFYNTQPFDSGASNYDSVNLPLLPVVVSAGHSYIKTMSQSRSDYDSVDGATSTWKSYIRSYGLYQFVSSAPSSNEISPPVWGYDGSTTRPTLTINTSNILSKLPKQILTGLLDSNGNSQTAPDLNETINRVCQSNVGRIAGENNFSRNLVPTYFTNVTGYGTDQSIWMSNLLIHLMGDQASDQEKTTMIIWLVHHGAQLYYSMVGRGAYIPENGGLEQGYLAAVVSMLNWTGNNNLLSTLPNTLGMNELRQPFYWEQSDLDRYANVHTAGDIDGYPLPDTTYSYMRRNHTISSVIGNTITLNTLHQFYFENDFDLLGLRITNGTQTAQIISHDRYAESFTVDDATGFSSGQNVTLEGYPPNSLPTIGTPDWGLRHTSDVSRTWYAGTDAYRSLNVWSMQVLFLEFLQQHTGFGNDAWRDECRMVNNNISYLGAYVNSPKRHETLFADAFWTNYQEAALQAANKQSSRRKIHIDGGTLIATKMFVNQFN